MKKWTKLLIFLGAVICLTSCGTGDVPPPATEVHIETESVTPALLPLSSVISDRRISVFRNGLSRYFQLSETGIYCLAQEKNGTYALYCDRQSDRFVKLCSRPDCPHAGESCDAFLDESVAAFGYYNGKLYYIKGGEWQTRISAEGRETVEMLPAELWQMDPDGRNKRSLARCWDQDEKITSYGNMIITNGYVEGMFQKIGQNGVIEYSRRYTGLDQPAVFMETAATQQLSLEGGLNGAVFASDGDRILIQYIQQNSAAGTDVGAVRLSLYTWEPSANRLEYIGDRPFTSGYFGVETAYIVEEGIVKQWDYQTHTETHLFDTGLRTRQELWAFPDLLLAADVYEFGELAEGVIPEVTLRFYDWNFRSLGECSLSFDREQLRYGSYIFGETEERILLVRDAASARPDYYIEKADFKSGRITLHPYQYPEMDLWD